MPDFARFAPETDPLGQALSGVGSAIELSQRNTALGLQRGALALRGVELQRQQAFREAVSQAFADNDLSVRRIGKIASEHPEFSGMLDTVIGTIEKAKLRPLAEEATQIYIASERGQNDVVEQMLRNRVSAAEAITDPIRRSRELMIAESNLKTFQKDPRLLRFGFGGALSIMFQRLGLDPDKVLALDPATQRKKLADIKLVDAQAQKLLFDLDNARKGTGFTTEQTAKFNAEQKLADNYARNLRPIFEIERQIANFRAAEDTGAGDIARILAFRQALEPGSIVRESEFAQSREAGGLIDKIWATIGKVRGEGDLTEGLRKQLSSQMDQLEKVMQAYKAREDNRVSRIASRFRLDRESIILPALDVEKGNDGSSSQADTVPPGLKEVDIIKGKAVPRKKSQLSIELKGKLGL